MNNYKILTLGASGAGKTVFLASMFKELSIQKDDKFKFEVEDYKQQKLLNSIYTQVITGETWPPGTRYSDVSEWTFTCRVQTENLDKYTACQFTYFDYAGGRLTDVDEDPEFKAMVKQADAILGLLDGQKIHAWISGGNKSKVDSFLNEDLPNILKWMQDCTVPIHFVISKWDLLYRDKISLDEVRDRLFTIPEFEQLVRSRNDIDSPIRLIPVSSVGFKFAKPEPDGSMKKIPGANPEPFQTETPVACVLPDRVEQLLNEIKKKGEIDEENKNKLSGIINLLGGGISFIAWLADLLNEIDLEGPRMILRGLKFALNRGIEENKKTSLKRVKDEQTALKHAINIFYSIRKKLGERFPQSELILPNSVKLKS